MSARHLAGRPPLAAAISSLVPPPAGLRGLVMTAALAMAAALVLPAPLEAQEDFRAADADRPILVEDAIPLKLREWEAAFGSRGTLGEGERGLLATLELEAGLFRNGQIGIEAEVGFEDPGEGASTRGGLEALGAHVFYHLRRETPGLPALAVRAGVSTPGAGALGREEWGAGVVAIATRSLDRLRLHGNAGYTVASDPDGGDYWVAGLAFDYPIGLFSRAILGDVYVEIPAHQGRTRVWAELGTRAQVSNWSVLDLGLATRLDRWEAGEANVELVIGVSRVFGIAGLIDVPPYPNPSIR